MRSKQTILLVGLAVAGFLVSGLQHQALRQQRQAFNPVPTETLKNSPPLVAFTTVALGGFRGILTDLLWLRVTRLQEEGKYFEIVQLSDWITKLEPHLAPVWGFHAWNMAYNISVLFPHEEDRWRWVQHGIGLLRDEGLAYNPNDSELYEELAWLFQHKLGATYDDAHPYYRMTWADEMEALLGPDMNLSGQTPEQKNLLQEKYRLNWQHMVELEKQYGALDWRHPSAHALYWATEGRVFAEGFSALSLDRMIYQNLCQLFFEGKVERASDGQTIVYQPEPNNLDGALKALATAGTNHPDSRTIPRAEYHFRMAAAEILEGLGDVEKASILREQAKTLLPE